MDREIVFAVLLLVLVGPALCMGGFWRGRDRRIGSGMCLERTGWQRVWLPLAPGALIAAALVGWVLTPSQKQLSLYRSRYSSLPFR